MITRAGFTKRADDKRGLTEGLNSKIQTIKTKARGFRNREDFKSAIYFHRRGLDLLSNSPRNIRMKPCFPFPGSGRWSLTGDHGDRETWEADGWQGR